MWALAINYEVRGTPLQLKKLPSGCLGIKDSASLCAPYTILMRNYGGYINLVEVLEKGLVLRDATPGINNAIFGPLELLEIIEMRETMTREEICKKLYIQAGTIDLLFRNYGIKLDAAIRYGRARRGKFSLSKQDGEHIDYLYTGLGYGTEAIAKELNCSASTVREAMKRFNIKVRSKSESAKMGARHRKPPVFTPDQLEAQRQRMLKMHAEGKMRRGGATPIRKKAA